MNEERNKMKREIARCDALAMQNEKDGYTDAAKQYRELALETRKQLAEFEKQRLKKLLKG